MTDRTPVKRGRGRPTMGLDHPKVQRVLEAAIRTGDQTDAAEECGVSFGTAHNYVKKVRAAATPGPWTLGQDGQSILGADGSLVAVLSNCPEATANGFHILLATAAAK